MEFGHLFEISATGMDFQRTRLEVIAANIANAQTTGAVGGGLYRPLDVVASSSEAAGFNLDGMSTSLLRGVQDIQVVEKDVPPRRVYDPEHPHADGEGFVYYPNINMVDAMTSLMTASRAYEANVAALNAAKAMAAKALEIGKG